MPDFILVFPRANAFVRDLIDKLIWGNSNIIIREFAKFPIKGWNHRICAHIRSKRRYSVVNSLQSSKIFCWVIQNQLRLIQLKLTVNIYKSSAKSHRDKSLLKCDISGDSNQVEVTIYSPEYGGDRIES